MAASIDGPERLDQRRGCGPRCCAGVPVLLLSVLGVVFGGLLGCGGDVATAPVHQNTAQVFWALRLNQHAVNVATLPSFNTVQLTATPLNVEGMPLTGLGRVTFRVSDSTVTVDSTGLMTAHYITQGQPTMVIAALTAQNYTLVDTVFVQVTDTVPQHLLKMLSLQPAAGDSAKRAKDINQGHFSWPVTAIDAAHNTICAGTAVQCPLEVYYTSSNLAVATIDRNSGAVAVIDTGRVVFTATTWAYGIALHDSIVFRIGLPIFPNNSCLQIVGLASAFSVPSRVRLVGVGAIASWNNADFSEHPYGVDFVDTTGIDTASTVFLGNVIDLPTGRGNIPLFQMDTLNFPLNSTFSRRFSKPGTYRWRCTGAMVPTDTFALVVQSER